MIQDHRNVGSDLWALLPSDAERQNVSDTLANGRLEGMEPDRELVEDLVAQSRGEISGDEFRAEHSPACSVSPPRRAPLGAGPPVRVG